jgi:hypothetical protein
MLLELSIKLLESSTVLLENINSPGLTHNVIIYEHHIFIVQATGLHHKGLTRKYQTRVEVTDSDKHTSLIHNGLNNV